MILESEGATASAPIEATGWPSKIGVQTTPASVVFQTPPFTDPKKKVAEAPAPPATAIARPPRNGPMRRHLSPFTSSGGTDWATAVMVSNRKAHMEIGRAKRDLNLCKCLALVLDTPVGWHLCLSVQSP